MSAEVRELVDRRWAEYGLDAALGSQRRRTALLAASATSLTPW